MSRRIAINLAVFAALAVVMVVWAFNNVVRFDFIDRPYHINVEFVSSPGLHPNFEVDYLGLRIGKIDSVKLEKDKVVVRLDIDRGVKVPQGVTAAAARKSAVGEPVVELTPPAGISPDAPKLKAGSVIPVSQTKVPPKYGDLFGAVIQTLKAIKPEDAKVLTHELAEGWSGREDSLRQVIQGGDQLSTTFANNTELLDGLTKDFGKISKVLADNRDDLGSGIDNVAALTKALAQMRGELTQLRDNGPDLLKTVNGLLDQTGDDLGCTVDSLGTLGITKYNPHAIQDLSDTLKQAKPLKYVLSNVVGTDQGLPVLNVVFLITLKKQAALEYKYPLPQPTTGKIPNCPDGRDPLNVKQLPYKSKNPGQTIPTHDPSIQNQKSLNAKNAANKASDSAGGPPAWLMYVPPLLALLVLIKVMMGSVPVVSRISRIGRFRRRAKDD
ncbi:MCE family protein [Actinomadura barringtoniae]|uniref:MCE family protein n=1 Tax=Actinomadura barringtoniae TaxID=1427535 RepID=A0A939T288_9ACTN|nr:MCE family protein [Actinomadura barringtoniae]MBO2446198.1 MCE family protein [Actinomadura barringtoniae]